MTTTVFCKKLNKEASGLSEPPFPGSLGKEIHQNISQEAWDSWLSRQTMLINEYRLQLIDPQAKAFLKEEMRRFLSLEDLTPDATKD